MVNLLVAFGLGALAGLTALPHCVTMCGAYAGFACTAARARDASRPTFAFLAARIAAYVVAGLLAGASGRALTDALPGRWSSIALSGALALGMIALAWRLVRSTPSRPTSPQLVALRRERGPRRRLVGEGTAAMLGAVMALFPCGALYAALLIAAGTSSAWSGGAVLLGFASVSALALGAASWIARAAAALDSHTRRLLGVALVVGAVVLVVRPLALREEDGRVMCHHEGDAP